MSRLNYILLCCFFKVIIIAFVKSNTSKPNLILIIADDLGWNDVGFHGSNQIPTPNIDALAYNGIILNRHYVLPTCTPSRAALMTGKYPIRTGLQGDPRGPLEPWAVPLKEKLLPQYLKEHGYRTHLIGKWHLGFNKAEFTPTRRGFDSHFGYYNGWIRYNDSVSTAYPNLTGIDARRNLKHAGDEFAAKYATDVFTSEAVNVIKNHDPATPLFLDISHVAVHALRGNILQVRDEKENDETFKYILDQERRHLAGVLQALDESVGELIKALKEKEMLDNSVMVFMSDNGGPTEDPWWYFRNSASNWPLRGMKTSLFEGGVRGAAAVWSPLFKNQNHLSKELFHITDWLPTFVAAAGGNTEQLQNLDGIDQWDLLTGNIEKTNRREILVNINHENNASAIISDPWKLISVNKSSFANEYAGVPGRDSNPAYDIEIVLNSITNQIINKLSSTKELFLQVREQATIDSSCSSRISSSTLPPDTQCKSYCLFNLHDDPCEFTNVAEAHPEIVTELKSRLDYYESISVPQIRLDRDPRANPKYWDNYWSPWLDGEIGSNAPWIFINGMLIVGVTLFMKKIGNLLFIV